jgi:hypothetical protein
MPSGDPQEKSGTEGQSTQSGTQNLSAADIYKRFGELEKAVSILEKASDSHAGKIEQLTRKADRTASHIPYMKRNISQTSVDLDEIGEIVRNARTIARTARSVAFSAVGLAILVWLWNHLLRPLMQHFNLL